MDIDVETLTMYSRLIRLIRSGTYIKAREGSYRHYIQLPNGYTLVCYTFNINQSLTQDMDWDAWSKKIKWIDIWSTIINTDDLIINFVKTDVNFNNYYYNDTTKEDGKWIVLLNFVKNQEDLYDKESTKFAPLRDAYELGGYGDDFMHEAIEFVEDYC